MGDSSPAAARRAQPGPDLRRATWLAFGVVAALVGVAGVILWPRWQNEHRDLVGLDHLSAAAVIPILAVTAILAVMLAVLGRLVWAGVRGLDRSFSRYLPRPVAILAAALVVIIEGNWLLGDVAAGRVSSRANSTYRLIDKDTDEGVNRPGSAAVSGSPSSLVRWEDLGRNGRNFVAGATSSTTWPSSTAPGAR